MLIELIEGRDFFFWTLGHPIFRAIELTVWSVTLTSKHVLSFRVVDEVEPFLFASEIGASNGVKEAGVKLLESLVERCLEHRWVKCVNGSHMKRWFWELGKATQLGSERGLLCLRSLVLRSAGRVIGNQLIHYWGFLLSQFSHI